LLARKLVDDILAIEHVNLYLFMSIFILAFLTRIAGIPLEGFTEGLIASISMPVTYVLTYYKVNNMHRYRFVKPKGVVDTEGGVARSWVKEFIALVSSYMTGFLIFIAITSSFNILAYTIAYVCAHVMRLMLTTMLPVLARHVDVDDPAVLMITSLGISLVMLAILFILVATMARMFPSQLF
jgi:hypothetical protein